MTYSLVALDRESGQLGVAVQTRFFGVGQTVPWARPGVGAVATQAFADRRYGALGLELLAAGRSPAGALAELTATDPSSRRPPGRHRRGRRKRSRPHGSGLRSGCRSRHRRGAQRTGEHDAQRRRVARDGRGVRPRARISRVAASRGARRGRGGRRRLPRAPGRGAPRRAERADGAAVGRQAARAAGRRARRSARRAAPPARAWPTATARSSTCGRASRRPRRPRRSADLPELDVRWSEIYASLRSGDVERARGLLRPLVTGEPRWRGYVASLAARGLLPHADELLRE